jgi:hypothetical protein
MPFARVPQSLADLWPIAAITSAGANLPRNCLCPRYAPYGHRSQGNDDGRRNPAPTQSAAVRTRIVSSVPLIIARPAVSVTRSMRGFSASFSGRASPLQLA